jgi:hypothetical protein
MGTLVSDGSGTVACLQSCCLATGVFAEPFLATVVSAGFTLLAFSKYATVWMLLDNSYLHCSDLKSDLQESADSEYEAGCKGEEDTQQNNSFNLNF